MYDKSRVGKLTHVLYLYNWKQQNPSFSDKPQGLISLLETVFFIHQPTWDDCQQLLQTLFTAEE
jgi:hypothetical protein